VIVVYSGKRPKSNTCTTRRLALAARTRRENNEKTSRERASRGRGSPYIWLDAVRGAAFEQGDEEAKATVLGVHARGDLRHRGSSGHALRCRQQPLTVSQASGTVRTVACGCGQPRPSVAARRRHARPAAPGGHRPRGSAGAT